MSILRLLVGQAPALAIALGITYGFTLAPPVEKAAMGVRYTQHVSHAARTEIVALRLASNFSEVERSHVVSAVSQWNHVLNGHIRFELDLTGIGKAVQGGPVASSSWSVVLTDGVAPAGLDPMAIAVTLSLPGGGVIVVFGVRLDRARLDRVMMHELGHVLGLPQRGSRGYLMSPLYSGTDQICIDKTTVEEVAALRRLPFNELNWCLF